MNGIFEFITMAFPKAGVQVGGLPMTVNMLLFGLVMLGNLKYLLAFFKSWGKFLIIYYVFFFVSMTSLLLNVAQQQASSLDIAMTLVVIFSPLAALPIRRMTLQKAMRINCVSAIVVGGYMLIQKIVGITQTALAGVTYTLGQDITLKPIGYLSTENLSHKMPSTYQNGNSSGLFLASSLALLLIWQPTKKWDQFLKLVGLLACVVGLFLCGSRSILFPMVPLFIIIGIQGCRMTNKQQRKWLWLLLASFTLSVVAYFSLFGQTVLATFYDRIITQTLENPSSDRFSQWVEVGQRIYQLDSPGLFRFFFIGLRNDILESDGMMRFLGMKGIVAQFSFLMVLLYPIVKLFKVPQTRIISYALIGVFIAFLIDMSFFYLPCIMNYFMVFEIGLKFQQEVASNQEEENYVRHIDLKTR